jgi:PAS domain S-box-containing protein
LLELLENPRLSVDEIVATAVERAVAMTGSEFGFIGLVAEDGTTVATRMSRRAAEQCGMNPDVPIDFRISGDGLWSTCLKDRRSFFVNEYVAKKELPPGHVPLRRVLGVPVVRDGKSVLICGLGNKTDPYDETDVLHVRLFVEGVCGAIERIRQEQALRRNERHYRALMEQSLDVVAVVAPDGAVIYQSPSIERVLGWRVPEVLGRSAYDFVHNDDREIATRLIGKVQPGAIAGGTLRLRHRDGSWRTLEAIVRNLTQDPDVAGIVVNARDITERQKLEAQYLHAQKLEAFGQLAGGIAHDFNNVLVVLLMQFGMMQREPNLPPAITGPLREMEALANRAASLTRQLLIFSRRQEYSMRTLDLNRAIEGVCGMLKRLIGENIEFNFQPAASPLWVEADVGMIEQVAVNLCVNARDAMPEGGRLSVTLASELRGSEMQSDRGDRQLYACLVVADTGCGMDEETRKRVFEPFFTTKPVGQGTGLGLATVYGIARQHHGWAEVETAPHRGSTFRVFFPCVPAPVDPRNEDLAQPPTGGTESVLLVEDEEFVRHAFALCLRRAGYAVVEAANAAEAVNAWHERGGAFALLLTDMLMPGRSGLDLAMELVAAQPALRVIVASGYTAQPAGSGSPFTPHLLYLAKPCSPDQLLRTIRTALDAK